MTLPLLQDFFSRETDFHFCQFFSNFFKYSSSNFLSSYLYNNFAIYFSGNSILLNSSTLGFIFTFYLSSISSCLLTSTLLLNSSTNSFAFPKSPSFFHVLLSAINLFHHTKYLSIPCIFLLFSIFSTSHSLTPSTLIGLPFFFF